MEIRHEDMPVVVRAMPLGIEADDAGGLCRLHIIEEQQFHQGGALGKHAEVHPLRGQGYPSGQLLPRRMVAVRTMACHPSRGLQITH